MDREQGGGSAYPQVRFVSLLENGTHVLFGPAGSRPLLCVGESGTPEPINARVKLKKARKD